MLQFKLGQAVINDDTVSKYSLKKKKKNFFSQFPQTYWAAQLLLTFSWAPNQHIRMISEGSHDTEDWSNDAENSALHHRNKLHF